MTPFSPAEALECLGDQLVKARRLLILLHNHPDPDAMASGAALAYLSEKLWPLKATLAYGGVIGRAENHALMQQCRISLKPVRRLKLNSYDRVALIDTQPRAGNHSLPDSVRCHIAIDHHPQYRSHTADLSLIDTGLGTTATLMVELTQTAGLSIPTDLATSLTYAIRSETQDLGREAGPRDIQAFFHVYSLASMSKLSKITYPKLPREYFTSLARTLEKALVFRHLIHAHLGPVPTPEIVAEMADMLVRHKQISWCLCTGIYRQDLLLSLRSTNPHAHAGKMIKGLVPVSSNAGGHDTFAGGRIDLTDLNQTEITAIEQKVSQKFASRMGYQQAEWKPLLASANQTAFG
jgi:nanoRNase/pAp phosphatase (c-di-AMP/oligoRNAs hydrolase)